MKYDTEQSKCPHCEQVIKKTEWIVEAGMVVRCPKCFMETMAFFNFMPVDNPTLDDVRLYSNKIVDDINERLKWEDYRNGFIKGYILGFNDKGVEGYRNDKERMGRKKRV